MNTAFLTATGTAVGDSYTLTSGDRHVTVRIAGEIFDPSGGRPEIIAEPAHPGRPGSRPCRRPVRRGAEAGRQRPAYANAVGAALGLDYAGQRPIGQELPEFVAILSLVATLTLLLAAVAGLGVLNTVVLQIRERVHDIGVFKAIGMTPRQTIGHGGLLGGGHRPGRRADRDPGRDRAAPLRAAGHGPRRADRGSRPLCSTCTAPGNSSCSRCPAWSSRWPGALAPASWAARTRTAFALRAE